jgi:hypothetical protein
MSIDFNRFGCIRLFTTASAVVLSVWMGVRGSVSICLMITASFVLRNNAPNSASAADNMTALIIVDIVNIAPLFGAELLLFDRKKCPPARLRALFLFAYPASL